MLPRDASIHRFAAMLALALALASSGCFGAAGYGIGFALELPRPRPEDAEPAEAGSLRAGEQVILATAEHPTSGEVEAVQGGHVFVRRPGGAGVVGVREQDVVTARRDPERAGSARWDLLAVGLALDTAATAVGVAMAVELSTMQVGPFPSL